MIYIVAQERQQAECAAHWLELPRTNWRYVADRWGLEGTRGVMLGGRDTVVFFGHAYRRKDYQGLIDYARAAGLTMLRLEDMR